MDVDGETAAPARPVEAGRDRVLVGGVAAITLVGLAVRVYGLLGHLPQLVTVDEPTTVERALAISRGTVVPPAWDWPPGGAVLDALVLTAGRWVGLDPQDPLTRYGVSRVAFAVIGSLLVVATAWLAARVTSDLGPGARRVAAWVAGTAIAVGYIPVRASRHVHPDPLQSLLITLSVGATIVLSGSSRGRRTAAALAGWGAAVKYVGGLVILPALVVAWRAATGAWARVRASSELVAWSVGAFVVATAGAAVWDLGGLADGLSQQLTHQSGGHLGFEATSSGAAFVLGEALPGTIGPVLTVAALAGIAWWLARGDDARRIVAGTAVLLLAYPLLSSVRFPHYVMPALPLLAVAAGGALAEAWRRLPSRGHVVTILLAVAVVAGAALPTLGITTLLRAATSPDTRELATAWVEARAGEDVAVWGEAYTAVSGLDRAAFSVAELGPEVVDCGCVVLVSSFQEERYRRLPERYAAEIAVYDLLRARGHAEVIAAPSRPLSYRWDGLPQWGAAALATAPTLVTGPTITAIDLRP